MGGFEKTIIVPEGVSVEVAGQSVKAKGPKGENSKSFQSKGIKISKEDSKIRVVAEGNSKKDKKIVNSFGAHIKNLVQGAEHGFEYKLSIVYSHFPMTITKKEGFVELNNLLGSKKPKKAKIMGTASVEVKGKEVFVKGASKEDVGQTAANIESMAKVKGKDRRIFQDGIYLVSKR